MTRRMCNWASLMVACAMLMVSSNTVTGVVGGPTLRYERSHIDNIDTIDDGEYYRAVRVDNDISLKAAKLVWHRSLEGHEQGYNSVALSARHPSVSMSLPSLPQFGISGRRRNFIDSFAEAIDGKNNTQFHFTSNMSETWIVSARHAYTKPAGSVNLFMIHQVGLHPHSTDFHCQVTGYDATASKPVWTYDVKECRFLPLDVPQYRRALVADDGSVIAFPVYSNTTDHNINTGAQHAQLHVLDAQTGKMKFIHRLSALDVVHHGAPSVSGRGEYITSVAGSRCDVYTSTGELRTKNHIDIHHESLVYMDITGDYLVYHDMASNLRVLKWNDTHANYSSVYTIHARDEKMIDWHPIDWEISYADNVAYLAVTWTRGRSSRTQAKLNVFDLHSLKHLWTYQSSRSRQFQTELIPSFQAPYIGIASWSNDDGADAQLMLFHLRSHQPIWSSHHGGSMWNIQIVVASAIPSLTSSAPNGPVDVIYLVAAGSNAHAHMPGVGQSYAYDLQISQL